MASKLILEVAVLNIVPGTRVEFEAAFGQAQVIIEASEGYVRHELQRSVTAENRYLLLVWWSSLEAHTIGFRKSEAYQRWKELLHHFYDPFPTVEHYEPFLKGGS